MTPTSDLTTWIRISDPGSEILGSGSIEKLSDNFSLFIASIPAIGTLFGSLFAGPISNWVGRKWTYVVGVCGTLSTGYILIALAQVIGDLVYLDIAII